MTAFVTVEGRTLAAAMKTINLVIERYLTVPILATVRLRTFEQAQLQLIGTNLDMELSTIIDVIDLGDADFDICLPANVLAAIASKAGPAPVRITPVLRAKKEGNRSVSVGDLIVRALDDYDRVDIDVCDGDALYTLQSLPAVDWPSFPDGEWTPKETFTNGRLASILDRVAPCISTEETRYYLNGVCWSVDTFGRHMVATDGHRLAACKYAAYVDEEPMSSTIIPYSAVKVLRKIAAGKDVAIAARWSEPVPAQAANPLAGYAGAAKEAQPPAIKHLLFTMGATTLATKTIDGNFPDWHRVVPQKDATPHKLEFKAELLRTALERVTMMSAERGRAVRIYRGDDGMAHLQLKNPDCGDGNAKTFAHWPTVPADPTKTLEAGFVYGAKPAFSWIGVNAYYLKTAIGKAPDLFILRFADGGAPLLIEDGDEEMTRVLMPMRV